ncbi:MAG: ABC transporter substrate-binding protein [Trueperaceae bacterium]|nr:ABC transporter substrate-binding protein [Trueperaceae bacterium]
MKNTFPWLAALALAVGGASAQAQDVPEVTPIGALLSFTGALAEFGSAHLNAVELAADGLNAAATEAFGGPLLELIPEDTATSPSTGVDRARKLVDVDGVPGIVGALSSGVTTNVAEAATIAAEVVQISPASTSPLISFLDDGDFVFRTVASDALQGVVAAQLARGELDPSVDYETAATVYVNNPYGQGLSNAFAAAFEARGGTVTAQVAHPEEPQPTYSGILEQALADDPDVLMVISYPGQATVYMQEARDLFEFTSFQFVDGSKSLEIIDAVGADVLEGAWGTAPGSDPEWPGFQDFVDAYQAVHGQRPPLPFMDAAYDAMAVLGLAVAQLHVDGVAATGPNLRDAVRRVADGEGEQVGVGEFARAIELMQAGTEIDYTGAASNVDFDAVGDVVTPVEVWRYIDGDIQTVEIRTADQIPAE